MQSTSVPLWINSFGPYLGGPYFILWFSSAIYVLVFFVATVVIVIIAKVRYNRGNGPPPRLRTDLRTMGIYMLIGFFDAVNGLLIIYASSPSRTPPILQAIFPNISVLYSIAATRFFIPQKKNIDYFTWKPLVCLVLILVSIFMNILPDILNSVPFSSGNDPVAWTIIFVVGIAPGVIYNVLQEKVLGEGSGNVLQTILDSVWMLFWGCMFQFLVVLFFFWVDILPWYGYSSSIEDFVSHVYSSILCFFGGLDCSFNPLKYGIIFNFGYVMSYCASAGLNIESANYSMLLSTLTSPISLIFWVIFPQPNSTQPPWWSFAFPAVFYCIASVLWKLWEKTVL